MVDVNITLNADDLDAGRSDALRLVAAYTDDAGFAREFNSVLSELMSRDPSTRLRAVAGLVGALALFGSVMVSIVAESDESRKLDAIRVFDDVIGARVADLRSRDSP